LNGLGMTSAEFIKAAWENKGEKELSQKQKDADRATFQAAAVKASEKYDEQQDWYANALVSLDQWGKGAYSSVVQFMKWLDGSVVKEGEYAAFTKAGIPLTGQVTKWINEKFTGDIPKSVKENMRELIRALQENSDKLYNERQYSYAHQIDANDPWMWITILSPELRAGYETWKADKEAGISDNWSTQKWSYSTDLDSYQPRTKNG
jgi:ATP:corrinoid adenosyltransferase